MNHLALFWHAELNTWVMNVPRAPTPEQVKWLREWVQKPINLNHVMAGAKNLEPEQRVKVLNDLIDGKIKFSVLGDNMDGKGDIRLFEAPKPREREYSFDKGGH